MFPIREDCGSKDAPALTGEADGQVRLGQVNSYLREVFSLINSSSYLNYLNQNKRSIKAMKKVIIYYVNQKSSKY